MHNHLTWTIPRKIISNLCFPILGIGGEMWRSNFKYVGGNKKYIYVTIDTRGINSECVDNVAITYQGEKCKCDIPSRVKSKLFCIFCQECGGIIEDDRLR